MKFSLRGFHIFNGFTEIYDLIYNHLQSQGWIAGSDSESIITSLQWALSVSHLTSIDIQVNMMRFS